MSGMLCFNSYILVDVILIKAHILQEMIHIGIITCFKLSVCSSLNYGLIYVNVC